MKNKVLMFIMGFLVGAIITTASFLIYNKIILENRGEMLNMSQNGQMGEPPEGFNGGNGEEPPEKPEGESNTANETSNT